MFEQEKNINNLKIILANEATKLCHGETASKKAEKTARETFTGIGHGSDLPQIKLTKNQINKGLSLLEFLASSKIFSSKSEARRAIANKGIKIDDVLVEDEKKLIHQNDFQKIVSLKFLMVKETLFTKNYLVFLFLSIIFCKNLGVKVLIGLIVVLISPGSPFIFKTYAK